jgi:chaperone LolA
MNWRGWAAMLAAAGVASQPARAETVDEIVRGVQARYDATSDFTATVHQEIVLTSAGKTVTAEGTVAFKRPGRMRWVLRGQEEEQVIVSDGTTLWLYQPEEKQVLKAPFEAAFRSTTPVSFLSGVGRIADDFDATLEGTEGAEIRLLLRARRGGGEVGQLRLSVERPSYDITGAEVTDPFGNVTRLRFSDLRRNVGLAEAEFGFEVPPGVDVIDAPIGY